MAIGKFLKGIAKDLKRGAKGSKEHQAEKAKKDKGKGGKNWYPGKYAGKGLGKPNTIGKAIENWLSPSKGYNFRDVNPFREAPKGGSSSDGVFRRVWNLVS